MPSVVGAPEHESTRFVSRVLDIVADGEGVVEEGLFALRIRHTMLLEVLVGVAFVPFEANTSGEVLTDVHIMYMTSIYMM